MLAKRIKYPGTISRPLRCPVKHFKAFIMEEIASFTFVGSLFARCGPSAFQKAWKSLAPAARHYLFAMDPDVAAMDKAVENMLSYAKQIEELVVQGQVSA